MALNYIGSAPALIAAVIPTDKDAAAGSMSATRGETRKHEFGFGIICLCTMRYAELREHPTGSRPTRSSILGQTQYLLCVVFRRVVVLKPGVVPIRTLTEALRVCVRHVLHSVSR